MFKSWRRRLKEKKKSVLSQIIEGNTIPTFVINKEHIVTHWNKALGMITGYSADEVIGTKNNGWPSTQRKDRLWPIL
jgi:PAS fold.